MAAGLLASCRHGYNNKHVECTGSVPNSVVLVTVGNTPKAYGSVIVWYDLCTNTSWLGSGKESGLSLNNCFIKIQEPLS